MDNFKRGNIPMQERLDLNKSQGTSTPKEVKLMQKVPYVSVVGSIMYAVRCTGPEVTFAQKHYDLFSTESSLLDMAYSSLLRHGCLVKLGHGYAISSCWIRRIENDTASRLSESVDFLELF
ncbi:hypothetical protein Tco_1308591, partial [Tanacetum coccineum]